MREKPGVRAVRANGIVTNMKVMTGFSFIILAWTAFAADPLPAPAQIAAAVLAAPADLRDGAAVLGFDEKGARVWLREGKNDMICLAPDPAKTSFEVDCYHKDLEPFMA